jgi:hypothetical protein
MGHLGLLQGKLYLYTYRHTDLREGFVKHVVEMGSGVIIYIPSLRRLVQAFRS